MRPGSIARARRSEAGRSCAWVLLRRQETRLRSTAHDAVARQRAAGYAIARRNDAWEAYSIHLQRAHQQHDRRHHRGFHFTPRARTARMNHRAAPRSVARRRWRRRRGGGSAVARRPRDGGTWSRQRHVRQTSDSSRRSRRAPRAGSTAAGMSTGGPNPAPCPARNSATTSPTHRDCAAPRARQNTHTASAARCRTAISSSSRRSAETSSRSTTSKAGTRSACATAGRGAASTARARRCWAARRGPRRRRVDGR